MPRASARPTVSEPPPGWNGTTMRTGFSGIALRRGEAARKNEACGERDVRALLMAASSSRPC